MMSIGITFIILYINLIINGYTIIEYLKFIMTRFECILLFIGLIMVYLSLRRTDK